MKFDQDCNYERYPVECDTCPMVKNGFSGEVVKEYENTYLINLDMNSICPADHVALKKIKEFNGRVVIAKKYVSRVDELKMA